MKMAKDTTKPEELRAKADVALAAAFAADAKEQASLQRLIEIRNAPRASARTSKEELAEVVANREWHEAVDAARAVHAAAGAALDAAEVALGDALATSCDAAALRDDLTAMLAEEDRLRSELAAVEQRRDARIAAGREAWSALDTRRRAAGLPGPTVLPVPYRPPMGAPVATPSAVARALTDALTRRVVNGEMPPARSNPERIRQLARRENELRIGIELLYRETERRRVEAEQQRKFYEQKQEQEQERERRRREEWAAKIETEQKERDELLAAQRAREVAEGTTTQ
jgi:hypothetical protein